MISYIKGKLIDKQENLIIVECNNIGYNIFASNTTVANIGNVGANIEVYTYMVVREDEISLYGFWNIAERDMFKNLLTVSGIGPKGALQVLSGITLEDLSNAIFVGDANLIGKCKGIGKKTAEKIVIELRGKVNTFSVPLMNKTQDIGQMGMFDIPVDDAVEALITLGLQRAEAVKLVRKVASPMDTAEDIIQKVLKSRT